MMTCGIDPDYSKRQLFKTIDDGGSYKWTMMVQVMTAQEAADASFDPFDVTKVWPRGMCPSLGSIYITHTLQRLMYSSIPNERSRRTRAEQKRGRLPPRCGTSRLFSWIIGAWNRAFARYSAPMESIFLPRRPIHSTPKRQHPPDPCQLPILVEIPFA